jgi:hypothetical protein
VLVFEGRENPVAWLYVALKVPLAIVTERVEQLVESALHGFSTVPDEDAAAFQLRSACRATESACGAAR